MCRKIMIAPLFSVLFLAMMSISAFAETTSYLYDDLHRLTRVERSNGTVITYAYDDLGNRTSKSVTAVSDITGPSLSIISHTNGDHVSASTVMLAGTASDDGKGDNGIQQVTVNGTRASNDTATGSGTANWNKELSLSEGVNNITIVAYDDSSAHNSTTQSITLYYDSVDTTGPSLSITSHTDGDHVSTSTVMLAGTASDDGKGDNGIQQVKINGTRASNDTATGSGMANWSKEVLLSEGTNNITVVVYDDSLGHNPTTHSITINYDSLDSTGPSLSITSHNDNEHVFTSDITLTGTASDAGKGDNGIQQVTVNGIGASNDTATGSGTVNWSEEVSLSEGDNNITVVAYDDSSRHNSTNQTITVQTKSDRISGRFQAFSMGKDF